MDAPNSPASIDELLTIMAQLRHPQTGCAWDLEQSFATIAPYTIEEAYEVADAIQRGNIADLRDELGDLLFQVVFHARMAQEAGQFRFEDVVRAICDKMIRRHPHIFADPEARTSQEQTQAWEVIKAQEREIKGRATSVLDDIPDGLPAMTRAVKLSKRAASVGFVWPNIGQVLEKLDEEIGELKAEIAADDRAKAREELGDVLFVVANIARTLDIDPEDALRATNAKFDRRFRFVEAGLASQGKTPSQSDLAEMDTLWDQAKAAEKSAQ